MYEMCPMACNSVVGRQVVFGTCSGVDKRTHARTPQPASQPDVATASINHGQRACEREGVLRKGMGVSSPQRKKNQI